MSFDLTPWQRMALRLLGDNDGRYTPVGADARTGSTALVKAGLATQVELGVYELTLAGRCEYEARRARARA